MSDDFPLEAFARANPTAAADARALADAQRIPITAVWDQTGITLYRGVVDAPWRAVFFPTPS